MPEMSNRDLLASLVEKAIIAAVNPCNNDHAWTLGSLEGSGRRYLNVNALLDVKEIADHLAAAGVVILDREPRKEPGAKTCNRVFAGIRCIRKAPHEGDCW
jgi:hypothetical protein